MTHTTEPHAERKVTVASLAAALTTFCLWLLGTYVFDGDVPEAVQGIVILVVPGIVSFIAGWSARHSPRPDLGESTSPPGQAKDGSIGENSPPSA